MKGKRLKLGVKLSSELLSCIYCMILANLILLFIFPNICLALEPDEILVIANRNAAGSVGLAKYYMKKRKIPETNLIKLWVTDKEVCSRADYEKKVVAPVRRYLEKINPRWSIRCLVIMYGMPLKVVSPELTIKEENEIKNLKIKKQQLENQLKKLKGEKPTSSNNTDIKANLKSELQDTNNKISSFKKKTDRGSSLDSELTLVLEDDYSLSGWIPNPYFIGFNNHTLLIEKDKVLMVSRLDGLSDKIVKRMIDDSLKAEADGLKGVAYFDARWPDPGDKKVSGYGFYDKSIHRAADILKKNNIMPVVKNDTNELFKQGECPDAAIYCGWYRLSNYVDAFVWQPGSIGYHIASGECTTLKRQNSRAWCKMMIEKGIAATAGPVSEPYVQAFPVPEIFFGFLSEGNLTLAECYIVSVPYLSWKMVLIGDPLYRPFKNKR
jgi:uncharacterized protein (TIGR03790 family)